MKSFQNHSKIYFGKEVALNLSDLLIKERLKNPLFVIDKNIAHLTYTKEVLSKCSMAVDADEISISANSEPTYDYLDKTYDEIKDKTFDCLVGIGGGSICDVAKGLGVLAVNPGPSIQYRGLNLVKNPGKKVILIPSTAGTGTEATKTAAFIDDDSKKKLGINGKNVDTLFAILDPFMVMSCPESVKISSGLDAMLHAVEAITARTASIHSKIQGINAFKLLYESFPNIFGTTKNEDAFMNMLHGSYLAGVAMFNAGGGPASGISYPLGVHFNIPHGIAGGIFLQHVFEFNVNKGYNGYDELYVALTQNSGETRKGKKFVALFKELYKKIAAPQTLRDYHVGINDVDKLVQLTMEQRIENLKLNPMEFGEDDVRSLLKAVIK